MLAHPVPPRFLPSGCAWESAAELVLRLRLVVGQIFALDLLLLRPATSLAQPTVPCLPPCGRAGERAAELVLRLRLVMGEIFVLDLVRLRPTATPPTAGGPGGGRKRRWCRLRRCRCLVEDVIL